MQALPISINHEMRKLMQPSNCCYGSCKMKKLVAMTSDQINTVHVYYTCNNLQLAFPVAVSTILNWLAAHTF